LAGPPSLDSCTRDIYAADSRFELTTVVRMAHGIASAARHLHAQGLMHGDLYAHNILHAGHGRALLGDFGAASFLAPQDRQQALALQRLEVRAFACLLEELLARCCAAADARLTRAALVKLKTACLQELTSERPLFDEVEQVLMALMPIPQDRQAAPAS
jgi:serine/threonine protein kinase